MTQAFDGKDKWGITYAQKADAFASTPWWQQEALEAMHYMPFGVVGNDGVLTGEPAQVLDFGCNTGRFIEMAQNCTGGRNQYYGLDVNEAGIQIAQRRLPQSRFYTDSADLPDEHFDHVVMIHVLPQIEDPKLELSRIWNAMKPGASICVVTHNRYYDMIRRPLNKLKGYKGDPTINHHYTMGELKQLMWDAGFLPLHTKRMGDGWPAVLQNRIVYHGRKPK